MTSKERELLFAVAEALASMANVPNRQRIELALMAARWEESARTLPAVPR